MEGPVGSFPESLKMAKNSPRLQLLDTAIRLFGESGIRATGIDVLIAEAGVAKMSLYGHFKSKDGLVVAVIDELSDRLLAGLASAKSVDEVFDALAAKIGAGDFRGCEFIRALSEFPDPASAVHQAVVRHRTRLRAFLRGLVDTDSHAAAIAILMDGVLVEGHASGPSDAVRLAKAMARTLCSSGSTG